MPARLTFRQIEAFRAVMLTKTTIAAARMLNTTQPSISRSLAQIQAVAKLKLFERDQGRLQPTPEAAKLFDAVQRNFLGLEAIEDAIAVLRRSGTGLLRIACTPALGLSQMPAIIADFKQQHPDTHITFRTISSYDIREGLANGLYDLGVTTNGSQLKAAQLNAKVIHQSAAVSVVGRAHPYGNKPSIGPHHFKSETLLTLDRDDDLSDEWRQALSQAGVVPLSIIETTYSATICRLAEAGVGIGVVNPYIAALFSDTVQVVPIKPAIAVKVYLLHPTHLVTSALADIFARMMTEHFRRAPRLPGKR